MFVNVVVNAVLVPLFMAGAVAGTIGFVSLCLRVWRRLRSTMSFPVANNRALYWPVALAIVWPLLFVVLWLLYEIFWLPLISEVFFIVIGTGLATMWVGSVVLACRLMIQWAAARRWRTILSTLILPLSFLLVLMSVPFLVNVSGTAADYVKFFPTLPSHLAELEAKFRAIDILAVVFLVILLMAVLTAVATAVFLLCVKIWERLRFKITSPVTDNRILYWPAAVAIVWPLLFVLLLQVCQFFWLPIISEYFLVIAGLGFVAIWAGTVVVACRLMIQWAAARQWRTALSTLILPLTFLLVLLSCPFVAPFLWKKTDNAAEYARFFVAYHSYLAQVAKEPATGSRFMVWMHDYSDRGLLYDETDGVASDHPSEAWQMKAEVDGIVRSSQRHIIGHFYFVRLSHL